MIKYLVRSKFGCGLVILTILVWCAIFFLAKFTLNPRERIELVTGVNLPRDTQIEVLGDYNSPANSYILVGDFESILNSFAKFGFESVSQVSDAELVRFRLKRELVESDFFTSGGSEIVFWKAIFLKPTRRIEIIIFQDV
jgi:hypothetical protein